MTQNLAKDFVDLSDRGLSPDSTPELALNHIERGLNIRPLVVVLQKGFTVEAVEMVHATPQPVKLMVAVLLSRCVGLEGDIGYATHRLNCVEIALDGVGFVGGYLVDGEGLGGLVDQSGKLDAVGGSIGRGLDAGDDVGLYPAHDVRLYPILHGAFLPPLVVKPSGIGAGRKARGVNGEVGLNRPQRGGGLLNETLEQGCQFGVFEVAESAGEGRRLDDQPVGFRFPQVGHKASAGHRGVDLGGDAEHDIGQRQSRPPEPVFGLLNAVAEVSEQGDKVLLLMGLGFVIGRPLLRAGHLDRLGVDRAAVWPSLPLNHELNGVDVLAGQPPLLEVGAGAERSSVVEVYDVSPVARLGGDFPAQLVFLYLARVGYYQPSFFPCVHFNPPQLSSLCAYNSTFCMLLSIVFRPILDFFIKFPIDKRPYCVLLCLAMNEVQAKIAQLQEKGWTLAAIADSNELGGVHRNTIGMWKAGTRYPRLDKPILDALDRLLKRNRIPKKKRYAKGSRIRLNQE
jgi:hypothetical protein